MSHAEVVTSSANAPNPTISFSSFPSATTNSARRLRIGVSILGWMMAFARKVRPARNAAVPNLVARL
jgi:hypothetical protein